MPQIMEVEVKRFHGAPVSRVFGWERITVESAMRLQDQKFRCPECLGKVRLRSPSADATMAAHGEHFQKHKGCSLGDCFDGEKRLHTATLE